jgi:hypothetical protein
MVMKQELVNGNPVDVVRHCCRSSQAKKSRHSITVRTLDKIYSGAKRRHTVGLNAGMQWGCRCF